MPGLRSAAQAPVRRDPLAYRVPHDLFKSCYTPLALLSFNVGIELGQLGFVLAVLGLGLGLSPLLRRLPAWSAAVPTYLIGTLAAFWMFERLASL